MPKRTLILIGVLIVITIGLLILALSAQKGKQTIPTTQQSTGSSPSPVIPHTVLSFSPNTVSMSSQSATLAVAIDTGGDKVTAIQLELQYDPAAISVVDIAPSGFIPNPLVLLKNIDAQQGRVSYVLGLPGSEEPKTASGTVATVTIRALKAQQQTQIKILPKSLVTATGVQTSVLKSTSDVTITLPQVVSQPATQAPQPTTQ